jgi:broad specificity polyphosphatase/5'/3'-nucleotidase SurE
MYLIFKENLFMNILVSNDDGIHANGIRVLDKNTIIVNNINE